MLMHVIHLAIASAALWTTSTFADLSDDDVSCPPNDWLLDVHSSGSLQDGRFVATLDGNTLSSSKTKSISTGSTYHMTVVAKNTYRRGPSFSGVLLEVGGGQLSLNSFRSDMVLKLTEPQGTDLFASSRHCTTSNDDKSRFYYTFSNPLKKAVWSVNVPFHVKDLSWNITVAAHNNKNNNNKKETLQHFVSTFTLDVGVSSPSSSGSHWYTKVLEVLLGLGTICVAIKYVLSRIREREQDYEQLDALYGDDSNYYRNNNGYNVNHHGAVHGTQVEFVPLG